MTNKTGTLRLLIILAFLTGPMMKELSAIPAFARKYQISCQVCHAPASPRLKAFGDEFAGAGFRMAEYDAPRYFAPSGDDKLSLIRDLPLAVRLDGHFTYNNENKGIPDFGLPYALKLMSGGELSDNISYYFYAYLNERGKVAGVEDAFLMFHDLLGTGINLYLGQFQVSDPLFKRELRLTLEDYAIYTVAPGNSSIGLKYDRGILLEYGLPTGTDIVAEVINGNGLPQAMEGHIFDRDSHKSYMIRLNQALGDLLSIGFFGYQGKEELPDATGPPENTVRMYGPDLALDLGEKLMLNLQYLRRTDTRSVIGTTPMITVNDVLTHGGFAEIIYAPAGDRSNWYLTALGNWVESDIEELDYKSATLHAGYLLRRNIRLVGEYTRHFGNQEYGRASVGFVSAF
ncbi:MAG: hypothetical protein WD052_05210 [Bacteroidales bacterium]